MSPREDRDMRPRIDGMGRADDYSRQHVSRRTRALADAGLLDAVEDQPLYNLAEMGQRYLRDELTQQEIDAIEAALQDN